MYIKDKIKDEYMKWERGQRIFISTPTGSGKTEFIVKVLLPYAHMRGEKVVLLVNRVILKKQLIETVDDIADGYRANRYGKEIYESIDILTYQEIELERKHRGNFMDESISVIPECTYLVCDEAHYFYTDSLFNTNTIISYKQIYLQRHNVVTIFMSATLERIKNYIMDETVYISDNLSEPSKRIENERRRRLFSEYDMERKYEEILINILSDIDEIPSIIEAKKDKKKWLIFLNDKKKGEELEKRISKIDKSEDEKIKVVFIDSEYENREDAREEVDKIVNEKMMKDDVVIATSVLDNGISIHDRLLENVVIIAENEEEFIQMLGRCRRTDGGIDKLNLYICKRNKEFFRQRLEQIKRTKDKLRLCEKYFESSSDHLLVDKLLIDEKLYKEAKKFLFQTTNYHQINHWQCLKQIQLYINIFSKNQIKYCKSNYKTQKDKFDQLGDFAFVRTQLEWMNYSEEEIDRIVSEKAEDATARNKRLLVQKFEEIINEYGSKGMTYQQYKITETECYKEEFAFLLKKFGYEYFDEEKMNNMIDALGKKDRGMTKVVFDKCMELFGLDYRLADRGKKDERRLIMYKA